MSLVAIHRRQFVTLITSCVLAALFNVNALVRADEKASSSGGQRVFYTGHSFHMFVPPRFEQLVSSAGITGYKLVGSQGIGGSRVIQHWDRPDNQNTAKAALKSGDVDVFTMAAHLLVPDPGIENFTELGLKHNPKLRLFVQGSWFPFDVPGEGRIRSNDQRDDKKIADLQAALDEWRSRLEAQVDGLNQKYGKKAVFIVPVGNAVVKLRALIIDGGFPGITQQSKLFRDEIGHGMGHVMALTTYCNFAAIYGRSPEGLTLDERGVDAVQHRILQQIAWETVSNYPYAGVAKP